MEKTLLSIGSLKEITDKIVILDKILPLEQIRQLSRKFSSFHNVKLWIDNEDLTPQGLTNLLAIFDGKVKTITINDVRITKDIFAVILEIRKLLHHTNYNSLEAIILNDCTAEEGVNFTKACGTNFITNCFYSDETITIGPQGIVRKPASHTLLISHNGSSALPPNEEDVITILLDRFSSAKTSNGDSSAEQTNLENFVMPSEESKDDTEIIGASDDY